VTVAGDLDEVVEGIRAFVEAGARHIVLLPCSVTPSEETVPWLPALVAELRGLRVAEG
jgi:hypothetical protein